MFHGGACLDTPVTLLPDPSELIEENHGKCYP
jgi:hypothetical protein